MLNTARNFIKVCDRKGIKYHEPRDTDSGKTLVTLGVNGSHGNSYDVDFFFDKDEKAVGVRVFRFTKANDNNYAKMLLACNELNVKYRWIKFCIDSDQDVNIEMDAVIDDYSAGEICAELFYRVMDIAKDSYPVFMRAQWG